MLALLRVTDAEDARWRDAAEDAEAAGTLATGTPLARWLELHRCAMSRVAAAAGALQRTARGRGKGGGPAVAAARALLEVEAVDAWGRSIEGEQTVEEAEAERLDALAWDLATDAERARVARLAERAREDREELEEIRRLLLQRARASI